MYIVTVNPARCTGCGECINVCPNEVFRMKDGKSDPYHGVECVFCESCLGVCEPEAIAISEI